MGSYEEAKFNLQREFVWRKKWIVEDSVENGNTENLYKNH